MATATAERKISTGNVALDLELSRMTEERINKLTDYARYLNWSEMDEDYDEENDDGSWADLPLTPEEEAQFAESEEDLKNGTYLTLEELIAGL